MLRNSGWQEDCFYYAETDPMTTEDIYPYKAITDTCYAPYTGPVKVQSYKSVPKNSKD